MDAASDVIGGALARRGAASGVVVGLFLPRGADLLLAQAGITKSGAAWLPFDADTPLERIKICLQSASAIGLVTCREWLPRFQNSGTGILPVRFDGQSSQTSETHRQDACATAWAVEDLLAEKNSVSPRAAKSSDPAYVIYTSGSTGQPKGIVISQRGICHFLRAENELLGVRADDRVYQGFSVAFDMSFEEIWISYLVGATLWIAPPSLIGDPDLLAQTLARERVTVLHAVPTLLSLLPDPLPTLRLINLGGEACPAALAARLARLGRKLFNTYGPTEASVSASLAELKSGEAVTIGMPLPNYGLLVVDEQRRPLPAGEVGELCIFGPGLALGYLGRSDLTAEKFVPNPLAENSREEKMYLTGDLARIESGGPVHCLGRVDSQLKIRGFRVELDEITAVLSGQSGVAAAAVVMRTISEVDQLVGFVVLARSCDASSQEVSATPSSREPKKAQPVFLKETGDEASPAPSATKASQLRMAAQWRQALAARLPAYMVPARFEIVAALPRLTSGKVDQKALREMPLQAVESVDNDKSTPRNEEEATLFAALAKLFPGQIFRSELDFFDDLGGHSLLAARLVSFLRGDARYASLGVQEIYRERQLGRIARAMERVAQASSLRGASASGPETRRLKARATTPLARRIFCGLAQALIIPLFVLLHIADWLAPFFVYHYFTGDEGDSIFRAVMYSLATFVLARFANFAVAIAGKRLTGQLRAGRYPLWGAVYFRWWLAGKFSELPDVFLIAGTPWMPLYLRALGARIGRDVMLDTLTLGAPELLTIEDGVSIGVLVNIENARVENGELILGPVRLKKDSVVDSYSVLEDHTEIGERAQLSGQSALAAGRKIPAGEIWEGAPARRSDEIAETLPPRPQASLARRSVLAILFAVTAVAVSMLFFLPVFPAFMLIDWLDERTLNVFDSGVGAPAAFGFFFLLAIPASALFLVVTMILTGCLRWLLPRQTAGMVSVHSVALLAQAHRVHDFGQQPARIARALRLGVRAAVAAFSRRESRPPRGNFHRRRHGAGVVEPWRRQLHRRRRDAGRRGIARRLDDFETDAHRPPLLHRQRRLCARRRSGAGRRVDRRANAHAEK